MVLYYLLHYFRAFFLTISVVRYAALGLLSALICPAFPVDLILGENLTSRSCMRLVSIFFNYPLPKCVNNVKHFLYFKQRDLTPPYVDDGLLEVVGFRDAWHGLILFTPGGHGTRLAQVVNSI